MNKIAFFGVFVVFTTLCSAQTDITPPALVCVPNLTLQIGPSCFSGLTEGDLIGQGTDFENFTVEYGLRKLCTGVDFPENQHHIFFFPNDLGETQVELWARDSVGNTSACYSHVEVMLNHLDCSEAANTLVFVETPRDSGIFQTDIRIESGNCLGDSTRMLLHCESIPDMVGHISAGVNNIVIPSGFAATLTPSNNLNPLNGITTLDLLQIQKHILGVQALDSPYKMIAADANLDGKVTTFDVVLLRKLLMGISTQLPHGKSWRFVPRDYQFPNPQHPFAPVFPEDIVVPNTASAPLLPFYFIGVKIGDVNFSADPKS
jgi:hypothetical protein